MTKIAKLLTSSARAFPPTLLVLLLCPRLEAAVPYVWRNVQIRGGGYVTGVTYHHRARPRLRANRRGRGLPLG